MPKRIVRRDGTSAAGDAVGFDWCEEDDGPEGEVGCRRRRQSLFSRRAHQRNGGPMANKLGQLRVVPKPQGEHVAGATEDREVYRTSLKKVSAQ